MVLLDEFAWQASTDMALAQEDIQFIENHLGGWLVEQSLGKPPAVYEIELRERMVRRSGAPLGAGRRGWGS